MSEQRMAYIGRRACGCVIEVVIDSPEHRADVAEHVARVIRQGLTIERVALPRAMLMVEPCEHREAIP